MESKQAESVHMQDTITCARACARMGMHAHEDVLIGLPAHALHVRVRVCVCVCVRALAWLKLFWGRPLSADTPQQHQSAHTSSNEKGV